MKTISLPVYNRPDALRLMLDSLKRNNTEGWNLFVSFDGTSFRCETCADFIHALDWMPKCVESHLTKLGLTLNTFLAPSLAFAAGSSFNLYLEDDLRLSPDALDLCNWYEQQEHPTDEVGLLLWRSNGVTDRQEQVDRTGQGGHGNGFACTRQQWEGFWRKHWFGYGPSGPGQMWDIHTDEMLRAHKLHVLSPLWPRSVQQRVDGTHGKASDVGNPLHMATIYDGPPVKEFKIA